MSDRPRAADLRTRLELPLNWNFRPTGYLAEARIVFQLTIYEPLGEVSQRAGQRVRPDWTWFISSCCNLLSSDVSICAYIRFIVCRFLLILDTPHSKVNGGTYRMKTSQNGINSRWFNNLNKQELRHYTTTNLQQIFEENFIHYSNLIKLHINESLP